VTERAKCTIASIQQSVQLQSRIVTILLSVVSALSGVMIVGPLSSYRWSELMLSKTLASRSALLDYWNWRFKQSGGVMGYLLKENPNWPKPRFEYCRAVIQAEYETFRRLRRLALITFVLFAALWTWVSMHFSYWVLFWYLVSIPASAAAVRNKGYEDALVSIFRATRLWMWADPLSLKDGAKLLGVGGVPDLLWEVETTKDPEVRSEE